MTKFKSVLWGILGIGMFTVLPLVHAQEASAPDGSPRWHRMQRVQEIYRQLNLTDDQKKQLEANKKQHRAEMEIDRREMKADRQGLQEELMKPQLNMPMIRKYHERIKGLQDHMEDEKLSSILAVRAILTQEQFSKLANLMHKSRQEEPAGEHHD